MRICLAANSISISHSARRAVLEATRPAVYPFHTPNIPQYTPSVSYASFAGKCKTVLHTPVVMKRATKNPLTHIYAHFNATTWLSSICLADTHIQYSTVSLWVRQQQQQQQWDTHLSRLEMHFTVAQPFHLPTQIPEQQQEAGSKRQAAKGKRRLGP